MSSYCETGTISLRSDRLDADRQLSIVGNSMTDNVNYSTGQLLIYLFSGKNNQIFVSKPMLTWKTRNYSDCAILFFSKR